MTASTAPEERRRRNFVVAAMYNPFTLPALGGSVLAAVVIGIHLGESSIGLINPIYFQGPAVHPRDRGAAIDEQASRAPSAPSYGQLYGWEEGRAARTQDCGDCEALAARDAYAFSARYSAEVPYFGSREEAGTADVRVHTEPRDTFVEEIPVVVHEIAEPKNPVLRYAYYPVEEPAEADAAFAAKDFQE